MLCRALAIMLLFGLLTPTQAWAKRCGPVNCAAGTACCNFGCGLCVPPLVACVKPLCYWGRPQWLSSESSPSPDVFDRAWAATAIGDFVGPRVADARTGALAVSAVAGLQLYALEGLSLGVRVSGSHLWPDEEANVTLTRKPGAYSFGGSARYKLPDLGRWFFWASTLDAEYAYGADMLSSLASPTRDKERTLSFAAGLAMSGQSPRIGGVSGFVRYLDSDRTRSARLRALDLGLGLGSFFDWMDRPYRDFGLRTSYRFVRDLPSSSFTMHQLEAGIYYRLSELVFVGVDGDVALFTQSDAEKRMLLLRLEYYWEANW